MIFSKFHQRSVMRGRIAIGFDASMDISERIELTLAIDRVSEPIAGAIGDGRGRSVEFSGWLGFAAAIEAVLATPTEPPIGGAADVQATGVNSSPAPERSAAASSSRE